MNTPGRIAMLPWTRAKAIMTTPKIMLRAKRKIKYLKVDCKLRHGSLWSESHVISLRNSCYLTLIHKNHEFFVHQRSRFIENMYPKLSDIPLSLHWLGYLDYHYVSFGDTHCNCFRSTSSDYHAFGKFLKHNHFT